MLVLLFLCLYFGLSAGTAGLFFPIMLKGSGIDPATLLNKFFLVGFLVLLAIRFFFQRSPRTDLRPYLLLPLSARRLAHSVQLLSVIGVINGLAICFLVPVWFSTIRPVAEGSGYNWIGGALALMLATHYLVLPLRIFARRYQWRFWLGAGLVAGALAFDQALGPQLVTHASRVLFQALMNGSVTAFTVTLGGLGIIYFGGVHLLLRALRTEFPDQRRRRSGRWLAKITQADPVDALASVEIKLALRSSHARTQLVLSLLCGFYLFVTPDLNSAFFLGFAGLISTGGFAMFYGQLLFSWDGAHFEGLLTRTPDLHTLLVTKLRVLQGSCMLLYLFWLPFVVGLRPGFLIVHSLFLLFNLGVTCPLVLLASLFNKTAVDLSKGSFSNQGAFNWTQIPFVVLIFGMGTLVMLLPAPWHLMLTAGLGLAGLAASPLWTRALTRLFAQRRYQMLAGFRAS
jgi:hypothetical protein